MRQYIRDRTAGTTYFFTLNLLNRQNNLLTTHIDILRSTYRNAQKSMPYTLHAMVVLTDHLHMLLTLPENDENYPQRISQIKSHFSRALPKIETINISRQNKGERGIWQRRYWEHRIRDELDFQRHMDYIHKTWLCESCNRLALFNLSSMCTRWNLYGGLGCAK